MSAVYFPEDWLTMRSAIQSWIATETYITTVHQQQDAPIPAKPFIRWGTLVSPVAEGRIEDRNDGPALFINEVNADTDYYVVLDGVLCSVTSDSDVADANPIRDALIDRIEALTSYTATAYGDAYLIISGNPVIDDMSGNMVLKLVQQYVNNGVMTITVEALTDSVDQQAFTVTSQLVQSLETESVIEALTAAGLALVSIENQRKTTQVQNAKWEDRAGFDVRFRVRTRNTKVIDFLEDASAVELDLEA